jgi:hypothetical protein
MLIGCFRADVANTRFSVPMIVESRLVETPARRAAWATVSGTGDVSVVDMRPGWQMTHACVISTETQKESAVQSATGALFRLDATGDRGDAPAGRAPKGKN